MKNFIMLALALILSLTLMAGCRRSEPKDTTAATQTTAAPATTVPDTHSTTPRPTAETTMPSVTGGTDPSDVSDGVLDDAIDDAIDDMTQGRSRRSRIIH